MTQVHSRSELVGKVIAYGFIGLFFAVAVEMAFFPFLPSTATSDLSGWLTVFGANCVGFLMGWHWDGWTSHFKNLCPEKHPNFLQRSPRFIAVIFAMICIFLIHLFFVRFVPHLIVLATGERDSQAFTVTALTSRKYCRSGVHLNGLPSFAQHVCGIPQDLRTKMKRGTRVVVRGKKGWAGIIPEAIEVKAQ